MDPHNLVEPKRSADEANSCGDPVHPRLMIVGPLPPPFGGVQLMIDMQRRSSLAREFELHVVDTSKRRMRVAVDRPSWQTPVYFVRDLLRVVRALFAFRPQLVLVHAAADLSFMRDCAMMVAARLFGAKVICHYHGTLHARFPSCETRNGRLAGRLLMSAAHQVIVLSPTYRREMSKAWARESIMWSPNTADIALYQHARAATRSSLLASGERGILFVGRLSAPKGIHELFHAFVRVRERHPDVRLLLMGVAENEAMEIALRREAIRLGIAAHVTFLGALDGREKAAVFAQAHMLVVPSWTEAFPLVIPEGMAAGLPIIATAVGTIPDFVKDGEDGFLIPARSPAALADRVERLLNDEALRQRMAHHVHERAPREFAIEVGAARVAAAARRLLLEDGGRAQASYRDSR